MAFGHIKSINKLMSGFMVLKIGLEKVMIVLNGIHSESASILDIVWPP